MKSLDEIFIDVCEVIESSTGINKNEIKLESTLFDELGVDSIDLVDILFELETLFDLELNISDIELKAKEELEKANELARETEKILKKAEKQAKNIESFTKKMDEAKNNAQKAIEQMYDAEREAELARLEAAAATATLGAIKKTKEVEDYAKNEAKVEKQKAKEEKKQARKLAREAKIALQDSILGSSPKSFLTLSYGQPFFIEKTLIDYERGINYAFSFGRRKLFNIGESPIDIGLEINKFDFDYFIEQEKIETSETQANQ